MMNRGYFGPEVPFAFGERRDGPGGRSLSKRDLDFSGAAPLLLTAVAGGTSESLFRMTSTVMRRSKLLSSSQSNQQSAVRISNSQREICRMRFSEEL